jgi:hypothetical protein
MASSIADSLQSFLHENGTAPRQQSKEEKKKCQIKREIRGKKKSKRSRVMPYTGEMVSRRLQREPAGGGDVPVCFLSLDSP